MNIIYSQLLGFIRAKHLKPRKSFLVFSLYKTKLFFSDQTPLTAGK